MWAILQAIEPRVLRLMLGSSVPVLAVLLFSFLLWPQIKTYRASMETRDHLQQIVNNGSQLAVQLEQERAQLEDLNHRLHGDTADLPVVQMESYIIGRLQKISWERGVELVSVRPAEGQTVKIFRELLFEVEVVGRYFDFFDWLRTLGRELGFVVIKRYQITPENDKQEDPELRVKLTMVSYRTEQ